MHIDRITADGFRNLEKVDISPHPRLNWVIGKNGSGKTSLLETIHCLGSGRSFRTSNSQQLINHERTEFIVFAKIENSGGTQTRIGIQASKLVKVIRVDGQEYKTASSLAEKLPVQIIAPDISKLVEEGPRYRRKFMDWGVFHVEHRFMGDWKRLTRVLKQRNAQLRISHQYKDANIWDQEYVELAEAVSNYRYLYIEELKKYFQEFISLVDEFPAVGIDLFRGWNREVSLAELLVNSFPRDQKNGLTQYGPHKSDLRIRSDKVGFREIASRGQIKLLSSILKFAQIKHLQIHESNKNVVLLIDDIAAEFDNENQQRILQWALNSEAQLFITSTDTKVAESLNENQDCKMFHVEHGFVQEMI